MQLINLTPDKVHILGEGSFKMTIPPSGQVARIHESRFCVRKISPDSTPFGGEIAIEQIVYGNISGLPSPQEGTLFIVSAMVAQQMGKSRPDLVSPGILKRDDVGTIIGCNGLTTYAY